MIGIPIHQIYKLTLVFLNVCVCCGSGIECSDDEALNDGQDEEVSRWEQEQIRKGISIPQVIAQYFPYLSYNIPTNLTFLYFKRKKLACSIQVKKLRSVNIFSKLCQY